MCRCVLFLLLLTTSVCFSDIVYVNSESVEMSPEQLYIDMIKRCVANTIYEDPDILTFSPGSTNTYGSPNNTYIREARENGQSWPSVAHTMIGMKRLNNIQNCMEDVIRNHIEGDVIETGVWRGGATILMRAILKAYGETERLVWVADSFAGLPPPNPGQYPADAGLDLSGFSVLAIPLEVVQNNFKKYGLLDKQVVFLRGLFKDTLPNAPINKIAILRLDGDLYESTINSLDALYHKVSIGGFIIVDDFQIPACARAIQDFRAKHNITDEMIPIDEYSVFWKKT